MKTWQYFIILAIIFSHLNSKLKLVYKCYKILMNDYSHFWFFIIILFIITVMPLEIVNQNCCSKNVLFLYNIKLMFMILILGCNKIKFK